MSLTIATFGAKALDIDMRPVADTDLAALAVGADIDLASEHGHHVPGTAYHYKHGWIPIAPGTSQATHPAGVLPPGGLSKADEAGLVKDILAHPKAGDMLNTGGAYSTRWKFDGTNWTSSRSGGTLTPSSFLSTVKEQQQITMHLGPGEPKHTTLAPYSTHAVIEQTVLNAVKGDTLRYAQVTWTKGDGFQWHNGPATYPETSVINEAYQVLSGMKTELDKPTVKLKTEPGRFADLTQIHSPGDGDFPTFDVDLTGGVDDRVNANFSADQLEAIDWYTRDGASELNDALRGVPGGNLTEDADYERDLDSAMEPFSGPLTLFRGINRRETIDGFRDSIGKDVSEDGYLSTTYSPFASVAADQAAILKIHAPEGTMGLLATDASFYPGEHEVTLARGTTMHIDDVRRVTLKGRNVDLIDVTVKT